jgi:RNA polymerase primary sigma factor
MKLPSFINTGVLDKKTERKLLLRASRKDPEARNTLIEKNQYLVLKIASSYHNIMGIGFTLEDLIQEGNIGLIRAVDKFKVTKYVRLSTYATFWIHQKIRRAIADKGRIVHFPLMLQSKFFKAVRTLRANPNARISREDRHTLEKLGMTVSGDSELSPYPANIEDVSHYKIVHSMNKELEDRVRILDFEAHLNNTPGLTERQKKVVCLRLGIYDYCRTFDEISTEVGITKARANLEFRRALGLLEKDIHRYSPEARKLR